MGLTLNDMVLMIVSVFVRLCSVVVVVVLNAEPNQSPSYCLLFERIEHAVSERCLSPL